MKLNDLLEVVHESYPDGMTRLCWDPVKQRVRKNSGDTLAQFIIAEIADTFDPSASDVKQLGDARDAMRWASIELTAVIKALEERKDAHTQGG